jgi:hypothetical protein
MITRGLFVITASLFLASGSAWSMGKSQGLLVECMHSLPNRIDEALSGRIILIVDPKNLTAQLDQTTPREWTPVLRQLDEKEILFILHYGYQQAGSITVSRPSGELNGWWEDEPNMGFRPVSGNCEITDIEAQ